MTNRYPNYLQAWRKASGLSQRQVEKMLSWPHAKISHLENGSAHITEEILAALGPIYASDTRDLLQPPARDRLRAGLGYQRPRRRREGVATLSDGVAMLRQLIDELHTMKVEHASRLSLIEKQILAAATTIDEAINNTTEMTERWQQDLVILSRAVRPKKTKSEPEPA